MTYTSFSVCTSYLPAIAHATAATPHTLAGVHAQCSRVPFLPIAPFIGGSGEGHKLIRLDTRLAP